MNLTPPAGWRSSRRGLVLLAVASYGTTFIRERFLLQEALGDQALEHAVAALAITLPIGNLVGPAISLRSLAGSPARHLALLLGACVCVVIVGGLVAPVMAMSALLVAAMVIWEIGRQRCGAGGHQWVALTGALLAPVATIAVWLLTGTESLTAILWGYACGWAFQAAFAAAAGWRHSAVVLSKRPPRFAATAYQGLLQVNGYLDRGVFAVAGGVSGALAAFGYNVADAACVSVAAPLALEAQHGRHRPVPRWLVLGGLAALGLAVISTSVWLPPLIRGGSVGTVALDEATAITRLYLLGTPLAIYVLFHTRRSFAATHEWHRVTWVVAAGVGLHAAIALVGATLGHPLLAVGGWIAGSALMAAGVHVAVRRPTGWKG